MQFSIKMFNESDLTQGVILASPLILGIIFAVPLSFIRSIHQAISSFIMFGCIIYFVSMGSFFFQELLIKKMFGKIFKYKFINKLYNLKSLKTIKNLHKEQTQPLDFKLKLFIRRWIYRCEYCFGLSLGITYLLLFLISRSVEISYSVAGSIYLISPFLIILIVPISFIVKDGLFHINQDIVRTGFKFGDLLTIFGFITTPFYWNYNPITLISFTSFITYNLLSNLIICFYYYKKDHGLLVNWFLNTLEMTNTN